VLPHHQSGYGLYLCRSQEAAERQRSAAGAAGPLKRFVIRRHQAKRRHGLTETESSSATARTSSTVNVNNAAVLPDAVTNSTSSPSGS
jgi:hypothetical protein